jgi:hypothetical protein
MMYRLILMHHHTDADDYEKEDMEDDGAEDAEGEKAGEEEDNDEGDDDGNVRGATTRGQVDDRRSSHVAGVCWNKNQRKWVARHRVVGRCRLTVSCPLLKAPMFSAHQAVQVDSIKTCVESA